MFGGFSPPVTGPRQRSLSLVPSPQAIDVSIIVVSYNTRAMTLAAIDSIVRETKTVSYEIIVVDNASADGSAEALAAHPAKLQLHALKDNIGFGRANTLGASYASGHYVLLLNPDTVVLDGAIDKLVAFAQANKRALIWGGRTLFADGSLNPSSCWGRLSPWSLFCRITGLTAIFPRSEVFNPECYGAWPRDCVRHVDIVSGCFLMIPRAMWLALGGFDHAYFMYGEEADLCLRAKEFGANPMITPDATILHYGGASEKARTEKFIKLLSAQATLIDRHWPSPLRTIGRHMLTLWPLSRFIALSAAAMITRSPQQKEAAATWQAIWSARASWRQGYASPNLTDAERAAQRPILPAFPIASPGQK
jgi:GT2 family glycosyltransferase